MLDSKLVAKEFQALHETLYFNSAYMGPYPTRTQLALHKVTNRWSNPSQLDYSWVRFPDDVRQLLGRLLEVEPDRFSLNSSTGEAISFYAQGVRLPAGSRVAVFHEDYPSDVLPWMFAERSRRVFEVDFYDRSILRDLSRLRAALDPRTRVLSFSQVGFQDGSRVDLRLVKEALRDRDVRCVVDCTQALGGLSLQPEEREGIDLLVCSTYKWLLAPYGQAFALWSSRALEETDQTHGNWLTQPTAPDRLTEYSLESKKGARRFDRGQAPNVHGMKGLEASLSLFLDLGISHIESHNRELVARFLENFNHAKYELITQNDLPSTIVCLRAKSGDSLALKSRLEARGIDVSVREGNLRISFHLFNTVDQVHQLLKGLE